VTIALVIFTLLVPQGAARIFGGATDFIVHRLGWLFHGAVFIALVLALVLPWGRKGRIVLGRPTDKPEFGRLTWLSMLFSAGMGIGLLFFGVAEPLLHYGDPPWGVPETPEARAVAMGLAFFHWGLHAWAVYAIIALSLAFHGFRHGLPFSIRSCLYPFLGNRALGRVGDLVDLVAVFGTIFGLSTSLGLGARQISAGLSFLFGTANTVGVQVIVVILITLAATASLLTGLHRGIRVLSEVTVGVALLLLLFVLVFGSWETARIAPDGLAYVHQAYYAFSGSPRAGASDWQASWTVFYWAWWIAWAPFVGTFIARISRGRTVREFILGVLFVPVGLTLLWFFVFGETALAVESSAPGVLLRLVQKDASLALYALLAHLPWAGITCFLALGCLTLFFVTSSDSGSYVVDVLTSGGHPDPPTWQRIFWASLEGIVACTLLFGGGLRALQSAAIATGLPFALVVLLAGAGIYRALQNESGP